LIVVKVAIGVGNDNIIPKMICLFHFHAFVAVYRKWMKAVTQKMFGG